MWCELGQLGWRGPDLIFWSLRILEIDCSRVYLLMKGLESWTFQFLGHRPKLVIWRLAPVRNKIGKTDKAVVSNSHLRLRKLAQSSLAKLRSNTVVASADCSHLWISLKCILLGTVVHIKYIIDTGISQKPRHSINHYSMYNHSIQPYMSCVWSYTTKSMYPTITMTARID